MYLAFFRPVTRVAQSLECLSANLFVVRAVARNETIADNYSRARAGADSLREHIDAIREEVESSGEAQRRSLMTILHTVIESTEFTVKESEEMYDGLETALEELETTEIAANQQRQLKNRKR